MVVQLGGNVHDDLAQILLRIGRADRIVMTLGERVQVAQLVVLGADLERRITVVELTFDEIIDDDLKYFALLAIQFDRSQVDLLRQNLQLRDTDERALAEVDVVDRQDLVHQFARPHVRSGHDCSLSNRISAENQQVSLIFHFFLF